MDMDQPELDEPQPPADPEEPFIEIEQALRDETGGCYIEPIQLFFMNEEFPGRSLSRLDTIRDFCGDANYEALRNGRAPRTGKRALIDERDKDGRVLRGRRLERVSTENLYRYMRPDYTLSRRIVHIDNPDGWDLYAWMCTARLHEIPPLGQMILGYVEQSCSIKARMSGESDLGYTLSLELTFPAIRKWARTCDHNQTNRNYGWQGLTRRKATPLYFLSNTSDSTTPEPVDCITLMHTSTLVVDRKAVSWTAYSLADAHLDPESVTVLEESSCQHCSRGQGLQGRDEDYEEEYLDPITRKEPERLTPLQSRQYFLKAATTRVEEAREEWFNTVRCLESRMKPYCRTTIHNASSPVIDRARDWVLNTSNVLTELHWILSSTVDSWDRFSQEGRRCFDDLPKRDLAAMDDLEQHFEDLRALLKYAERLKTQCLEASRELDLHLASATHSFSHVQQQQTELTTLITRIAFLFAPVTLTTSIFSMQSGVIPGEPNMYSFLSVGAFLTAVVGVLFFVPSLLDRNYALDALRAVLGLPRQAPKIGRQAWQSMLSLLDMFISATIITMVAIRHRLSRNFGASNREDVDIELGEVP